MAGRDEAGSRGLLARHRPPRPAGNRWPATGDPALPRGVGGAQFFQKHGHKGLPRQIRAGTAEGEPYLAIDDGEGLVAMAQISAIELHAWGASERDPSRPDRIVFDLDPGEGVGYADVVDAALLLRERLDALKLVSFCRTTGGHGLHVVTPLSGPATWAQARGFSKGMAEALSREAPQRFVATVSKEARRGRILIDWLRNGPARPPSRPFPRGPARAPRSPRRSLGRR